MSSNRRWVIVSIIFFIVAALAVSLSSGARPASSEGQDSAQPKKTGRMCFQCRSCGKLFEMKGLNTPDKCPACGYVGVVADNYGIYKADTVTDWSRRVPCGDRQGESFDRVRLCEEALEFYGKEMLKDLGFQDPAGQCNLTRDGASLKADFEQAIEDYRQKHGPDSVRASIPIVGGFRAAAWLAKEGGLAFSEMGMDPDRAKQFVFARNPDSDLKNIMRRQKGVAPPATHGTESALYDSIVLESEARKNRGDNPKLRVGEIFRLSLEQTDGDARLALLLAHNTMRSLARPGDSTLTGVQYDPNFFETCVETLREDRPDRPELCDKGGPMYHLFGTAYFEMQMRGDYGGLATLWNLMGNTRLMNRASTSPHLSDRFQKPQDLTFFWPFWRSELRTLVESWDSDNPLGASELANAFEQMQRIGGKSGPEDPEKYCVNLWGARLGADLFKILGGGLLSSPFGPVGAPEPVAPPRRSVRDHVMSIRLHHLRSPFNIRWQGEDGSWMVFDQKTESLYGFYAVEVWPFYEPKGTWGAVWMDYNEKPHTLVFEAVGDGELHYLSLDTQNGQAFTYRAKASKGERFTLPVDPDHPGRKMTRSDGLIVDPRRFQVSGNTKSSSKDNLPIASRPQKITTVFDNGNIYAVESGKGVVSPSFVIDKPFFITRIQNYHWNGGRGAKPGTIALKKRGGDSLGPWIATGLPGQGGAANVYWITTPGIQLEPGTYTVVDSDPATWAHNPQSSHTGFTRIEGYAITSQTR